MSDNDKSCPRPLDVQDFLFKEESTGQICEGFQNIPVASSLIAADGKRGLLYIGHENKLIVVKPGSDSNPQWKLELELPFSACRVEFNCDYSYLAVTLNQPIAVIYDASSISKHKLDKLHEIRLSPSAGDISVSDFKWNPAIPDMFCSITSDHVIGCFQVSKDKGLHIVGSEKPANLDALCVSWSPKGKQLVVGCKNGDIVQLKPELKVARHLSGPNPSQGVIISILWISNYQFCACYFEASEERISVMIADAPKGAATPKFTNYEDITFGGGSMNGLCYYFEYVTEWGLIIAASTHSSELAVLGTADNGATWNMWQLAEGGAIQLPLNRKQKTENYPVGIAIDKSSTQRLPWGPENTLPNPVPILRILVTSGQLCCYHMVNLKANAPVVCSPPTEIVSAPSLPRPSLGPSEVSFNIGASGATSTPQKPLITSQAQPDRTKANSNMFGDAAGSSFSFAGLGNKFTPDAAPQNLMKNIGFAAPAETKMTGLFGQPNAANKQPSFAAQPAQPAKPAMPSAQQAAGLQQHQSPQQTIGFSQVKQAAPKTDFKIPSVPALAPQPEPKPAREPPKDQPQSRADEARPAPKSAPVYDEGICLQAFREEKSRFEAELKTKLQPSSWDCGTEEERLQLVKRTAEIEEFFKELQDTTSGLAVDIAYLKALLLQSFAWLEESKSKTSANSSLTGRGRSENAKFAELQSLYYYTQTQLIQATKVLDLKWTDHKDHELSRMKIPSTEIIYQSLLKHSQIIAQQKKSVEELTKKWRSVGRGRGSGHASGLSSLDRSMASLNLSQPSSAALSDTAIDLRCKLIASTTRSFSREKQMKLRDLLAVTEPRIIPAARPTAVQDGLQATLSSLASAKPANATAKAQPKARAAAEAPHPLGSPADAAKPKPPANPLSSLDSLVSGLGGAGLPYGLSKSPSSAMPFAAVPGKPMFASPAPKPAAPFAPSPAAQQPLGLGKTFSFASPPKAPEAQVPKTPTSDAAASKVPTFTFAKQFDEQAMAPGTAAVGAAPKFNFSTTTPSTGFGTLPKADNASIFKFSTKTSSPPSQQPQPSAAASLEPITPPAFSFSKTSLSQKPPPPTATDDQFSTQSSPTSASAASPAQPAASSLSQMSFGKAPLSMPVSSLLNNPSTSPTAAAVSSSTGAAATPFGFSPGSNSNLGPISITALPNLSAALAQATATTTTAAPSAIAAQAVTSTTGSSPPNFSGLLGATASLNFGATPASTASPGLSSFGNIFGGSTTISKVDSSAASTTASTSTTTSGSSTSIFGDAGKTSTSIFGGQTTISNSSGSNLFGIKPAETATTASGSSIFGTAVSSPSSTSIFGGSSATTPAFASSTTTPTSNVFGTSTTTQSGTSIFGGSTTTTTPSSGTTIFATSTQSTTGSLFGASATPSTTSSLFGSSAAKSTTSSPFATSTTQSSNSSVFGANSATGNASIFGAPGAASPVFGTTTAAAAATTTSSSIFGSASASSPFGASNTSMFGASATPSNSIFGAAAATASTPFGSAASTTTAASVFGSPTATASTAPSLFGNAAAAATSAPSMFGTPTATTSAGGSMFGAALPQATGGWGFGAAAASPTSGGSVFGGPPAMGGGASTFGAASPGSAFGQPAAFGSRPVFGGASPGFGGGGFGSPPAFGAAPTAGFGSPSFGATAPAASTSPGKVLGSSTFEALGAQSGGLSFGSLAQKTPEQKPQAFQGSSSFSSWR